VTVMYHGTDSRAAQLIASSQRFLPSAQGLLGKGIYMTRTRVKAEGYRVHHPGAGAVGADEHNLPLPSGDADPGCILRFRVKLGACKTFARDCPEETLWTDETWHDAPVPDLEKTKSMRAAAAAARAEGRLEVTSTLEDMKYNSAFSPGCRCCPVHGDDCPGSPLKDHRVLPDQDPCEGRCNTGFRVCPGANTTFEEYCLANTERISQIEIVAGPAGLVGYGPGFWHADQATRDAAHAAHCRDFAEWEIAHPEIVMAERHDAAAKAQYEAGECAHSSLMSQYSHVLTPSLTGVIACVSAALTAAQLQVELMGVDTAAAAACAQFSDTGTIGGVLLERNKVTNPFFDGIYAFLDIDNGWPRFQSVSSQAYLYYRVRTSEWIISNYYEPDSTASSARIPCDSGSLPLGMKMWWASKQARAPQTAVLMSSSLAAPAEVAAAQAAMKAEREEALSGIRAQLEGVTSIVVAGASNPQINGTCK
jgi:hypothetical protein